MKAWHWTDGWKLSDGRKLVAGKTYTHVGPLVPCVSGLHGSARLLDSLCGAAGAIVSRVEFAGSVIAGYPNSVARRRTVLWAVDAKSVLYEFACRCAEDALALVGAPDPRSVAAVAAKRMWLRGEIDDAELDAARDAAWEAVIAAPVSPPVTEADVINAIKANAAPSATVAARGAAMAAMAAAHYAAKTAWRAGEAAIDAAWRAASDASIVPMSLEIAVAARPGRVSPVDLLSDARNAAKARQNRRLTAMVCALRRPGDDSRRV